MHNTAPVFKPFAAIIGLGNPGAQYERNRHNIGFRVVDALVQAHHGSWKEKGIMEIAQIILNGHAVMVIKPLTYMNDSGKVIAYLAKQGITADKIVVVHDELELPFGELKFKMGGSHKGHNGLRSIIGVLGDGFARLRFGVGRPEKKEDVPRYVLENFKEPQETIEHLIEQACSMIEACYK